MDNRYHPEWKIISKLVKEQFGWKCARCSSKKLLQTHHIDGNPRNNHQENLIALCACCHLQIEKEARVHSPGVRFQLELFQESTYQLAMKKLRQKALAKKDSQK